jgi:hypothetical protein
MRGDARRGDLGSMMSVIGYATWLAVRREPSGAVALTREQHVEESCLSFLRGGKRVLQSAS